MQATSGCRRTKMPFDTYCEVHNEPDPSNSMVPGMQPAIAMGPTGNIQGSYIFLFSDWKENCVKGLDGIANV